MADKIMLIRHAEKPGEPAPPPFGVDESGAQNSDELIVRGWQRAGALACLFSSWGVPIHAGLLVPVTIYAAAVAHHSHSLRPQHTVAPLCARLGINPIIDIALGNEATLAVQAQAAVGPVLIAWHHEAIPELANIILGNTTTCPQEWDATRFDLVWVFDRTATGWQFSQVPQLLLAGDSVTPIV